jgi:hypothetical protein
VTKLYALRCVYHNAETSLLLYNRVNKCVYSVADEVLYKLQESFKPSIPLHALFFSYLALLFSPLFSPIFECLRLELFKHGLKRLKKEADLYVMIYAHKT